ncbi:helix-turn-helix domain-containing protein [Leisingera daeponensis]|uniref:RNA polymerase sigma-54 factor n=1 Tax=Leisingera daeponensis TaxID=405746 RepID=A0ABS7NMF2_9RHOB|nr:helix-turn-helix domain-containing protein [Leisingera daeponensis]MBY6141982.1 helix-turn-helix domain-containing protein [Leisingera daeponensis]
MPLKTQLRVQHRQVFRLGQVVTLLQMSAAELDEHLAAEAQANPMLVLRQRRAAGMSATDVLEMTAVEQANSLYDHVFRELAGLIGQGGLMEKLITALIAELEPSGWLARAPAEIAESLELSGELVETALRVVQKRVDPAGLFARDLIDCLRLQLEDQDVMTEDMEMVLDHLPALESGGPAALVRATELSRDRVQDCLALLRRLDPKPGSAFVSDPTLTREPDVRITPSGEGWEIEFLSSWQGDIEIAKLPRGGRASEASEALAKARALKHALDMRVSALKEVVGEIVERQGTYFRFGDRALAPMTLSEIARETGFHLSTVSRVLNGLLIEGPNGIVLARNLFTGTASAQATQSKPQVQARIRALLADEDPKKPLSDRRLTAILQSEGIAVSRRVVSKYRQDIGIHAAAKRRLRA